MLSEFSSDLSLYQRSRKLLLVIGSITPGGIWHGDTATLPLTHELSRLQVPGILIVAADETDMHAVQGGAAGEPGSYKLVLQFPRRVIAPDQVAGDATLRDAGLTSRQEALLVEPVSS